MPFSFVQIEQDKTRTIQWSFAFLVLFYFLAAYLIVFVVKYLFVHMYLDQMAYSVPVFDWKTFGWTSAGAGLVSFLHWNYATDAIIDKIVGFMGARTADPSREDEKRFQNVVEEVTVATGGKRRIEAYIVPTTAMNAFALQDFEGRSIIGITEGLLKRLSREQLEAVIAHEAGHLAAGDSLSTTVTSAIFKVFDNLCDLARMMLDGYGRGRGRRDGRIFIILLVVMLLASLLRFIGFLGAMFISREREYRADALSVRLTRNPLALAEALHIIDSRWKGGGMPGESMDAIFIQSPRRNAVEDGEDWFAEMFTTHPPIRKRIGILLDMAHADKSVLDAALKGAQRRAEEDAPADGRGGEGVSGGQTRWMVNKGGQWLGPFDLEGMQKLAGLGPETVVRRVGGPVMLEARLDRDLWAFLPAIAAAQKNQCPRCNVPLSPEKYEAVNILRCQQCSGVLVSEMDVLSIVGRREMMIAQRVAELGEIMLKQPPPVRRGPGDPIYDEQGLRCPFCLDSSPRMTRRFVNQKYPVEIDKCRVCARVWFDKDELELLQYMYEKDNAAAASRAK